MDWSCQTKLLSYKSTSQLTSAHYEDGRPPREVTEKAKTEEPINLQQISPFLHLSNQNTILGTCGAIHVISQTSVYSLFMENLLKQYNLTNVYDSNSKL